jgi:hypothetical protein
MPAGLTAPCLPPGVSAEFFFWPIVAYRSVELRTEDGATVEGTWVVYNRGDQAVAVVWTPVHLIAVDPSPETDDPDWIDGALVSVDDDGFILRAKPDTACKWLRNTGGVRV